jgi:SAM-dependent methyltransferase
MAFFDHFAGSSPTHVGAWLERLTKQKEQAYISRFLKSEAAEILEIGPGQGLLAQLFIRNGFSRYDASEPNPQMNSQLSSIGVRAVSNYVVPPIQAPGCSYDALILTDVLEHLTDAESAQGVAKEAARVLRPGGILIIASPDCLDWKGDFFNCDFTHNYVTTLRRARQLLYDHGFRIAGSRYTYGPLTGIAGFIASRCVKLLTFFASGARSDDDKPYKLRLTFLRRFTIVGVRE